MMKRQNIHISMKYVKKNVHHLNEKDLNREHFLSNYKYSI